MGMLSAHHLRQHCGALPCKCRVAAARLLCIAGQHLCVCLEAPCEVYEGWIWQKSLQARVCCVSYFSKTKHYTTPASVDLAACFSHLLSESHLAVLVVEAERLPLGEIEEYQWS